MTWDDAAVVSAAKALFAPQLVRVERMREGGSTYVYRVTGASEHFYLRVLPETNASFAPEAHVHRLLLARGVHVPAVVHVEHHHAALDRSLMLTTEIAGQALGYGPLLAEAAAILRAAGRELAVINRVPVHGWGWIRRDQAQVEQVCAEHDSFASWFAHDIAPPLAALRQYPPLAVYADGMERLMHDVVQRYSAASAVLAHGDFDPTHIYHDHGAYSGIIDFGEMRGAPMWYDLAHFAIENQALLPDLLAGYAEITLLPPDHMQQIKSFSLLIAARRAGLWITRRGTPHPPDAAYIQYNSEN